MPRATVILVWVVLLAGGPLRALPLRDHGGVIFGSDFLRILDPRERTRSEDDPSEGPQAGTTTTPELPSVIDSSRHTDETRTMTESLNGQTVERNLMFSSRYSRKLDPSVVSSAQYSSSFVPERQKLLSRKMPEDTEVTNHLKPRRKFPVSSSNNPTASTVNGFGERNDRSRSSSLAVTNEPENDFRVPYEDFDYSNYYYYLDDLVPLASSAVDNTGTASVMKTTRTSSQGVSIAFSQVDSSRVTRVSSAISSTTTRLSLVSSLRPQKEAVKSRLTTFTSISATPTRTVTTPLITATPETTIRTTPTKRPTTKRSTFRYRTSTDSAPRVSASSANPTTTTSRSAVESGSRKSSVLNGRSSASSLANQRSSESITVVDKSRVIPSFNTPKPRTSVTMRASTRLSQTLATPLPLIHEHTTTPVTTKSTPVTVTPSSVSQVHGSAQKSQVPRNKVRHFRYTTPLPKPKKEDVRNVTSTPASLPNENTQKKSLGSTSSSSVVVEVRVESPRRDPRVLSSAEDSPRVQTVDQGPTKVTPATPARTVHTVLPDRRTTSFLLSDPLTVDVAFGPTTSSQDSDTMEARPITLPRGRSSSTVSTIYTSTTTTEATTTTTTTSTTETSMPTTTTTGVPSTSPTSQTQQDETQNSSSNTTVQGIQVNKGKNRSIQFQTSVVEVSGSIGSDSLALTKDIAQTSQQESQPKSQSEDEGTSDSVDQSQPEELQSQSVSTSVSRTEAHTAERVSSISIYERLPKQTTVTETPSTSLSSNATDSGVVASLTNNTEARVRMPSVGSPRAQQGLAPLGVAPFGEAPEGLAPFGHAPEGLAPYGVVPGGLNPHGLAPQGLIPEGAEFSDTNTTTNTTQDNGTRITFVDATVSGGADANSTVGYVVEEHNVSRFRLEEKTPDGFIIGEYGVVDHNTGDVNGVRYTADSTADPHLIYETLMKFLEL